MASQRIDLHSHAIPPGYRQNLLANGYTHADGLLLPEWSATDHLALMDSVNISRTILSISTPGTYLVPDDNEKARRITREVNEELAAISRTYPRRFSFFASLPLPDVEGSLAEIDYALDVLGAVGFVVLTNSEGLYLGNKTLAPVLKKLNDREAIVFVHPTTCKLVGVAGVDHPVPVVPLPTYLNPIMEFLFDSARTVVDLLLSNTVAKNPSITFISAHCGGVLPPMLQRVAQFAAAWEIGQPTPTFEQMKLLLQEHFYFDMAGFPFPDQLHGMLRVTKMTRLVYGSDFPFTPAPIIKLLAEQMSAALRTEFGEDSESLVESANAMQLFANTSLGRGAPS